MKEEVVYTVEELSQAIVPIVKKHNADRAVLFGSYARGAANDRSDLDVLVYGGESFKPRAIFAIAEEIYEALGKNVDVYERHEIVDGSPLLEAIEREGVAL